MAGQPTGPRICSRTVAESQQGGSLISRNHIRRLARSVTPLAAVLVPFVFGAAAHSAGSDGMSVHAQDAEANRRLFASIKPDPHPIVVYGEPRGSKIEFLRTGATTCGKYLYARVTVPAGSGPPPHVHHWTDEWFYVPTGGIVMFHGNRAYKDLDNPPDKAGKDVVTLMPLEKGEIDYGPRDYIHGYTNATDGTLEVDIVWTPDTKDISILGYFLAIYSPVFKEDRLNARFNSVQPIRAVAEGKKYGMNFSHDFWQYIDDVSYGQHLGDAHLEELKRLIEEGEKCAK